MKSEKSNIFEETVLAFQKGKTVLYPTDTIWGMGCNARLDQPVAKIISIKNKPSGKGLIILIGSLDKLQSYTDFDLNKLPVATNDRPTTYIIPNGKQLALDVLGPDGSLAFRIPKDGFCKRLLQELDFPIVSTSANFHTSPAPKSFEEISKALIEQLDHVVPDDQQFKWTGAASQIIQVNSDGSTQIIRE